MQFNTENIKLSFTERAHISGDKCIFACAESADILVVGGLPGLVVFFFIDVHTMQLESEWERAKNGIG